MYKCKYTKSGTDKLEFTAKAPDMVPQEPIGWSICCFFPPLRTNDCKEQSILRKQAEQKGILSLYKPS